MPSRNALNATLDSIASLHALRSDFSFAHFLSPHAKQTRRRCKRGLKNTAYTRQLLLPSSVLGCNYTHALTHTRTHRETYFVKDALGAVRVHTLLCGYIRLFHTPLSSTTNFALFLTRSLACFSYLFLSFTLHRPSLCRHCCCYGCCGCCVFSLKSCS